jgi:hypothetical protein
MNRPGAWPNLSERFDMEQRTCGLPGCEKPCRHGRHVCEMHYYRMRRTGTYEQQRPWHRLTVCAVEGCEDAERHAGMCALHSTRVRRHGDPHVRLASGAPAGPDHPSRKLIVRYESLHQRIARECGRASEQVCVDCHAQADEWSYDHAADEEQVSSDGLPYSTDINHYLPRCHSCHTRYDYGRHRIA